ncbi:MAG: 16S rRNA (cytidine(1402)-2'-O)-methyltransferase [Waddliaceae bacterium]
MLYIVATPIGNLGDITHRAIETLKSCDYILCEDTRRTGILLSHWTIKKPLKSFYRWKEAAKEEGIIADLHAGRNICLVSDAGTPGISDPGTRLIKRCHSENLPVTSIPGACAAIIALSCSGMNTDRFQFLGFLPRKVGALKTILSDVLHYPGTTVCYESPKRLEKVLRVIAELDSERHVVVTRELTKKFEEIQQGRAAELLEYFASRPLKGEIVLLIAGE